MRFIYTLTFILFFNIANAVSISESIKSTVENNVKIRIGLEKINEAKELIAKSSGELLPDISSSISGTYSNSEVETSTTETTPETFTDNYKLTIKQNLLDGGYDNLEIDRSKILFENEKINFEMTINDLILDAINGYLTVLNYQVALEANKINYSSVQKLYEETNTKYEIGSATIFDLQAAESSFANAELNLFEAEQNLIIGKKTFKRIVGLEPIDLDSLIDIDSNISLDTLIQNGLSNNFSIKLLINDITNKEILFQKEQSTKKPSLDFTGSAEYSDTGHIDSGSETTKGTLGLTLTIPIFKQGIDDSNIRKYHSQILQAELNLEDTKEDLRISISNTFKDFKVNEYKMIANDKSISSNQTSLDIIKEEYNLGTKTISDLLTQEENLLLAKLNYSNSKKDYLISYFNLKSLEGSLLENFKEYIPSFD
ncbi:MAG: Outer membrane protein TolC [Alphaproteobacteria bacterium MarineAlpha5_Bin9]|nr:MAG: Outer membrane protein TolC [Alphaproteobacteria bacterium MarineAlpha5_Bin9]|tara:strand:- start:835 stop:2118 length:1284 start_codon:yes stop_codon:yes gene_type:complete